jgi:uncharacterized membrane protein
MPVDKNTSTVVIAAPFDTVMETIRDVEGQQEWVKEIHAATLLEEYEDGLPATARFDAKTGIGEDVYTLAYEHEDDAMTWNLVESKLMKRQDGGYRVRDLGDGTTEVALTLEIDHSLHAPGFVRARVFKKFVGGTVNALKAHLES